MHGKLSFTVFDISAAASNPQAAVDFFVEHGCIPHPFCHKCEKEATRCTADPRGRLFRCPKCRQRFRGTESTFLEGSPVPHKILWCAYLWSTDHGFSQCKAMLGASDDFVNDWFTHWRCLASCAQERDRKKLGGPGTILEMDCSETGRFQKGIHGHKSFIRGDLMAIVQRGSPHLVMELFNKLKDQDEWCRRFGPEKALEVLPLLQDYTIPGGALCTDGAKAYIKPAKKCGLEHHSVDHSAGIFSKQAKINGKVQTVHSNTVDGLWGHWKAWYRAKRGVRQELLEMYVSEFVWRWNNKEECLFRLLLQEMRLQM